MLGGVDVAMAAGEIAGGEQVEEDITLLGLKLQGGWIDGHVGRVKDEG